MYRTLAGMGLVAAAALAIGYSVGSAQGQQKPAVDLKVLGTVDGGEECSGHILRMRRVTFAPGSSVPMHSHKTHPEVSLIIEGTLTNTVEGQPPVQLVAGTPVPNGPEVEHFPANDSDKQVVVLSVDLIRK